MKTQHLENTAVSGSIICILRVQTCASAYLQKYNHKQYGLDVRIQKIHTHAYTPLVITTSCTSLKTAADSAPPEHCGVRFDHLHTSRADMRKCNHCKRASVDVSSNAWSNTGFGANSNHGQVVTNIGYYFGLLVTNLNDATKFLPRPI